MLTGRFAIKIVILALAGALVVKKIVPVSEGRSAITARSLSYGSCLSSYIIGVLSFLPALALGPIAEQLLIVTGGVVHV